MVKAIMHGCNGQMDRILYDLIDVYMEISSLKFLES